MIYTTLIGGTGNQMFQYAIARSLSIDLKTDFSLILFYNNYFIDFFLKRESHDRYNLNHFNIKEKNSSILKFISAPILGKIKSDFNYIYEGNQYEFDIYNQNIRNLKGDIFLKGYWHNEKYFLHNEDIIREDFKIKTPPSEKNKSYIDEIFSVNAVALCVRRNDYLNPFWKAQLGICTLNYYKKSTDMIAKSIENPIFYVFSDDPEWVKKNIKLDYPTIYVTHNGFDKDYEDLRLISSCKHFIISNSTFHWWGAWLSSNKDKIVIAPEPWLNSYTFEYTIPKKWNRIKCDRSELYEQSSNKIFELHNNDLTLNKSIKIKMEFLKINSFNHDTIIKIVTDSKNKGILKLSNKETKPIFIGYYRGLSIRYIYLDKTISLNSLKISSVNNVPVKIKYIGIKSV
ncbi:MAG: alpha-1,2-fucosyltransferase [Methanobacteriaceae archaeon]|jgi:hypothetical protein|nr:alpha-1,2-fucosyltransferase [Candidatus Methanorudis spinitermitis]